MTKWRKLGRIFEPRPLHPLMQTHASNPTVLCLGGSLIRVYFSSRAPDRRASIGWATFDLEKPLDGPLEVSTEPVVTPGPAGTFDDSGVSMACLAQVGDELCLYYLGWNLSVTVPWRNSIGLAVSLDGGRTFEKRSAAPWLDRNDVDPITLSYPWVLQRSPGDWLMVYGSTLTWGLGGHDEMDHPFKVATSTDGFTWNRDGKVVLPLSGSEEIALAKPTVIQDGDLLRMWFSIRGKSYHIGYAESHDGTAWNRQDHLAGIAASDAGWDSSSVEYPCVFDAHGARWMVYNGNGYGLTGFGLAIAA